MPFYQRIYVTLADQKTIHDTMTHNVASDTTALLHRHDEG